MHPDCPLAPLNMQIVIYKHTAYMLRTYALSSRLVRASPWKQTTEAATSTLLMSWEVGWEWARLSVALDAV